jgi:hypothetical protein
MQTDSNTLAHEDGADWARLEAERADLYAADGTLYRPIESGVKYSNTPHPGSAYADLPMRGICHSKTSTGKNREGHTCYAGVTAAVEKRNAIALWPEPKAKRTKAAPVADKSLIKKSAPHPHSAYSHLPLSGLGLSGNHPTRKWTLSADEKRTLAGRPLRYVQGGVNV